MTKMPEYTPVPPVLETHRMISSAAWRHMECIITELIFQERDSRFVAILETFESRSQEQKGQM